eukprot:jgi/Chrzof1/9635/Cz04g10140.t1
MAAEDAPMVNPMLVYKDPSAAIDYVKKTFGFEEHFVAKDDKGKVRHAELKLGDGYVMISPTPADGRYAFLKSPKDMPGVNGMVYVYVRNLAQHYENARAAGAQIEMELQRMDYGSDEYMVKDLEGHYWSFGSYRPGSVVIGDVAPAEDDESPAGATA